MIKEAIATGATLEEAKESALKELGAKITDDVSFDILEMPKKKTFGLFGGALAKVKASYEVPDPKPSRNQKTNAPVKKEQPIKKEQPVENKPLPKREIAQVDISSPSTLKSMEYLSTILEGMGVKDFTITPVDCDGGIQFDINGNGLGVLIGRRGETLDAVSYLVSLVANCDSEEYIRVSLNPGGYKEKRQKALEELAEKTASKAISFKRNFVLEPMNPYERRVIHNKIGTLEEVLSWSIGEGENRRVCIGTSRENPFDRGRGNSRNGGGRPYGNNGRNNGGNRPNNGGNRRPAPHSSVSAPASDREKKTDGGGPLYGRIK